MSKKMLIDATHAEETRVVVVDGNKVDEFDFESEAKRQLAGNIYLAKVTRVEPSLQAAFVDYGGNRHGFLAFSEIHPDYYQIPVADREALLAEEMEEQRVQQDEDEAPKRPSRSRSRSKAAKAESADKVAQEETSEADAPDADTEATARTAAVVADIPGMDVVDLEQEGGETDPAEASDVVEGDAPAARDVPQGEDEEPDEYSAMDDAAERDADIESVADDDVSEEIRRPRKPKRKYKIQEVIKVRQILLVQVVKEERGNKGAALTTYLSLAGRYCVLMPNTARGGGISRKITNATDRKKLKDIAASIDVPKGAGLIIRTAGSQRTKTEIRRDYEYLQRMWEQIRELTLKSIAPAKIYEEGDLIKRSIRDLYTRDIEEVLVEGPDGYRTAKDFMKMIMPSHAKNVKHYVDPMPLFARYQVESYLSSMFNPTVQLKSGGYIVIGVTEALVAIDVNSGRATKEGSIEETALKTNLEAAEEVARQLRLRDLAGLIVIDFIDMEERKNNSAVEKKFKEKLKTDRARIQVGRISGFGLLEMSRQRLRPGMIEATTQPCPSCHGTGLLRSDDNLALNILRQIEEEGVRNRTKEVLVKAPVGICNFLLNHKRDHIAQIEARYGMSVRVEADPMLISPDFSIDKFKTQTRVVEQTAPVVSADPTMIEAESEVAVPEDATDNLPEGAETQSAEETPSGEDKPKKRRRRRRRKKSGSNGEDQSSQQQTEGSAPAKDESPAPVTAETVDAPKEDEASSEAETASEAPAEAAEAKPEETAEKPKRRRTRSRSRKTADKPAEAAPAANEASETAPAEEVTGAMATADAADPLVQTEPAASEETAEPVQPEAVAAPVEEPTPSEPEAVEAPSEPEPAQAETEEARVEEPAPVKAEEPKAEEAPEAEEPAPEAEDTAESEPEREPAMAESETEDNKPKKRGWWSLGS
ncbi:RNAse E [Tranquillimonas rosea]|uniref:Ribonuclease E n=1 Tax=Tranquillimonas rosea TaxID=641238 RepID=A0A1H9PSZ8_9RHOB|nr:ribonuclease E/G [Tranquillimonas rosea]SER51312.1 RNAse E [Tranquillimonas rosea]